MYMILDGDMWVYLSVIIKHDDVHTFTEQLFTYTFHSLTLNF